MAATTGKVSKNFIFKILFSITRLELYSVQHWRTDSNTNDSLRLQYYQSQTESLPNIYIYNPQSSYNEGNVMSSATPKTVPSSSPEYLSFPPYPNHIGCYTATYGSVLWIAVNGWKNYGHCHAITRDAPFPPCRIGRVHGKKIEKVNFDRLAIHGSEESKLDVSSENVFYIIFWLHP